MTALQLLGKFCTSLTFVVLYMQTAELYPTCVRSFGTGASSLVGIGAGALTPFILQLVGRTFIEVGLTGDSGRGVARGSNQAYRTDGS